MSGGTPDTGTVAGIADPAIQRDALKTFHLGLARIAQDENVVIVRWLTRDPPARVDEAGPGQIFGGLHQAEPDGLPSRQRSIRGKNLVGDITRQIDGLSPKLNGGER